MEFHNCKHQFFNIHLEHSSCLNTVFAASTHAASEPLRQCHQSHPGRRREHRAPEAKRLRWRIGVPKGSNQKNGQKMLKKI